MGLHKPTNVAHVTPADITAAGRMFFFSIKEHLKANGWTVMASGDGVGVYGASSDVITSSANAANGVRSLAWVRLRAPDGVRELCGQVVNNGEATTGAWRWKYSSAAGFTGGSPSASRVPSATDEGVFAGAGSDASPTGVQSTATGTNASVQTNHEMRVAGWCELVAPYRFVFVAVNDRTTSPGGHPLSGLIFDYADSPMENDFVDSDPTLVGHTGAGGNDAAFHDQMETASSNVAAGASPGMHGHLTAGTPSTSTFYRLRFANPSTQGAQGTSTPFISTTPTVYWGLPGYYFRASGQTDTTHGIKGASAMMRWVPQVLESAARARELDAGAGTREWVKFNYIAVPWQLQASPWATITPVANRFMIPHDPYSFEVGLASAKQASGIIAGAATVAGELDVHNPTIGLIGAIAAQSTLFGALNRDGAGGGVAPVISNLTPADGSTLPTTRTVVGFDVTDADSAITGVILTCKLRGTNETFVVWDGAKFLYPFAGLDSIKTVISGGLRFRFRQYPEWTGDITRLQAYAFDGNLEGELPPA